ncbi:MAG: amino acid ABC transporter substrate-binding protein [Proteobacteria bacterium]|nr:amino acid ABC transporter substrate-binding protein [Pseudomonadota bacterium]
MKNTLLIICFIWAVTFSNGLSADTIRVATGDYPPLTGKNLKHYGLMNRIVTEAFALEGVTVEYGFFPWGRSLEYVRLGEWDATSYWSYNKSREKDFLHSDPILEDTNVFFHLKSFQFDWDDWSDLQGLNIGVTLWYSSTKLLKKKQKIGKYNLQVVTNDELNIRKLLQGRIQLYPLDPNVFRAVMKNKFSAAESELITSHPKLLNPVKNNILFSRRIKGNERRLKLFNNGLRRLREEGKIEQFQKESD